MASSTLALLGLAAILAGMARPSNRDKQLRSDASKREEYDRMVDIIRREARAQGVPEAVALAMAWVESKLDPNEEGDLYWHENETRFDNVVPQGHPWRWKRDAWHSYGLFQLLAPYHVKSNEAPAVLLDPIVNAHRGIKQIAKLWRRHDGDLDAMRLAYVGRPTNRIDGPAMKVLNKWHAALARFGYTEPRIK
jgi:hypothetical protein